MSTQVFGSKPWSRAYPAQSRTFARGTNGRISDLPFGIPHAANVPEKEASVEKMPNQSFAGSNSPPTPSTVLTAKRFVSSQAHPPSPRKSDAKNRMGYSELSTALSMPVIRGLGTIEQ